MGTQETRIVSVTQVGHGGVAVEIETPESFAAQPGQFVKLTATIDGAEQSSMFTISSPDTEGTFETTVAVDPDGDLSPWLADAKPDTSVGVSGPYGRAFYEGEFRTVILSGGPGIGPALALAERTVQEGGESAIVYRDDEPLHLDRLATLRERGITVTVLDSDDSLEAALEPVIRGIDDEQVFVYGFQPFVETAQAILAETGGVTNPKIENFG